MLPCGLCRSWSRRFLRCRAERSIHAALSEHRKTRHHCPSQPALKGRTLAACSRRWLIRISAAEPAFPQSPQAAIPSRLTRDATRSFVSESFLGARSAIPSEPGITFSWFAWTGLKSTTEFDNLRRIEIVKYKTLALILALTVASWAQTSSQTTPSTPQQSAVPTDKAKCACCDKMASADAKDAAACCAHQDTSAKGAMSCMRTNKNKAAASCCKESCGKGSCTKDKTSAACCAGKCGKDGKACCAGIKADKTAKSCCQKNESKS